MVLPRLKQVVRNIEDPVMLRSSSEECRISPFTTKKIHVFQIIIQKKVFYTVEYSRAVDLPSISRCADISHHML